MDRRRSVINSTQPSFAELLVNMKHFEPRITDRANTDKNSEEYTLLIISENFKYLITLNYLSDFYFKSYQTKYTKQQLKKKLVKEQFTYVFYNF